MRLRLFAEGIKSQICKATLAFALVLCCGSAQARSYDDNPGYLNSVDAERADDSRELRIVDNPDMSPPLQNRIFNQELMTEFRQRYEDRFGSTDALRTYYNPNRYNVYSGDEIAVRQSVQTDNDAKRSYANYMLRRLLEYHATNYAKSDPNLHGIVAVKEAVTSASASPGGKASSQYKVKAGYNIGANVLQMNFLNPYVNTRFVSQLSKSNNNDNVFVLSRDITPTIGLEGRYQYSAGVVSFVGSKRFSPTLGGNLTLAKSSYNYSTLSAVREDIVLAGMTYNF